MKDAKGHGSDPRGGANAAKAMRAQLTAAHQSGIARLGKEMVRFAKDTSGDSPNTDAFMPLITFPEIKQHWNEATHKYHEILQHSHILHDVASKAHHFFG